MIPQAQQGLLRHIFCPGGIAQHPIGDTVHRGQVPVDNRAEGDGIPRRHARHQRIVAVIQLYLCQGFGQPPTPIAVVSAL
jgi:hypothetical protein